MERKYLKPIHVTLENFPADPELPAGCREIKLYDDDLRVSYIDKVVYAERDGVELYLQVYVPELLAGTRKFPLLVNITGSGWRAQDMNAMVPTMCSLCKRGYVIASAQYRHTGIAPFPAQVQDIKTAMRFMKKNAAKYHVDVDRTAYIGCSSGGHTAAMCGITGDGEPDTELYGEYSAEANAVVDWFGPTAIELMNCYPSREDHTSPDSCAGALAGGVNLLEHPEAAEKINPAYWLSAEKKTPPILIMHGDKDILVPFNQSVILYNRLKELDKDVEFYKVLGASHGTNGFFCEKAWDIVDEFLKRKLDIK